MKIYTTTGDQGETGLLGGVRVSKSHRVIDVCGSLDETNSFIGWVLSDSVPTEVRAVLAQIQNDLFDLGSRVAACQSDTARAAAFPATRAKQLEDWIDQFQQTVPELREFILPGGCRAGAALHVARGVARRAERSLVGLIESQGEVQVSGNLFGELIYLNRLGDLLFVLARAVNQAANSVETKWTVTR